MEIISGKLIDIFNRNIFPARIWIENGIILKVEETDSPQDQYILPGFIDAHVHIESSLMSPSCFAECAVQQGTVAVVADPHEIANVCGIQGMQFMIESAKSVPFQFYFGAPSCVPATSFETNGAEFHAETIEYLFKNFNLSFLSEMMNFPGVINGDKEVLQKIEIAKLNNKPIDGHAPGLRGEKLNTYIHAGISTDHECTSLAEAEEKIEKGMKILIRQGSAAKNFEALYPLIAKYPDKVMICTDDCHPEQLLEGHITSIINRGLELGLSIFDLLQAACLNPVQHYNMHTGLLRKNDSADFIIASGISPVKIKQTWIAGKCIYSEGITYFKPKKLPPVNNFTAYPLLPEDLLVKVSGLKMKVIHALDGELYTPYSIENAKSEYGFALSNPEADILKIAVINRYRKSSPALGFVKGFNLKIGALATSVAHDSHNIIAVGTNDKLMAKAINEIVKAKGGLAACTHEETLCLPLEVGGLMCQDSASAVANKLAQLNALAKQMGCTLASPFMTLSFLSLLVIPSLKIGDRGLFEVDTFSFTNLFVND